MKKILALILIVAISTMAFAQQNYKDVVYLKNGSIIGGMIIEQVPNQTVKIQTADGNVFVYNVADIEKITKEPVKGKTNSNTNNEGQNKSSDVKLKNPGLAFLFSAIAPGAGQYYNKQWVKGSIMIGVDVAALTMILIGPSYGDSYGSGYYSYYEEDYTTVWIGLIAYSANAIWSMIDAPVSAGAINRRHLRNLTYNLNNNVDIALKPDYRLDRIGGKINHVFGAKLCLNLH